MAYAKRVDQNQKQITEDLRKIGAEVTVLSSFGQGVADLLVSYQEVWFLFELKNPLAQKSDQKLTPDEKKWISKQKAPVYVVKELHEILQIFYNHFHEGKEKS